MENGQKSPATYDNSNPLNIWMLGTIFVMALFMAEGILYMVHKNKKK